MSIAKPYLISNLRTGLERDVQPWLLPEDAFPDLEDCFMFRGRIQRRRGLEFLGRLVSFVGTANGGAFAGTVPDSPLTPFQVYIVVGTIVFFDDGSGNLASNVGGTVGTIVYATGVVNLTFSPALGSPTTVSVIDNLPVMGLRTRELNTINEEALIAFDTKKANVFSTSTSLFDDITFYKTTGTAFEWTGTNSDFFWTVNYLTAFWATNGTKGFQNNPTATTPASGDGIRWYDGTGWVNFLPAVDGTNFLMGSVIMVSYRNRLVMLNTTEGTAFGASTHYAQRARWCQNGTPYYNATVPTGFTGGFDVNAWRSDVVGKGGFIDAPTGEQIISADFYKDTLIVFFERSTWQLRYTGNETLPFIWERINVDLGGESTFSIIPFNDGIVAVGNYGIVSCDATGVKRIDQIIPDEVFDFHNGNDGPKRVYGIRDYPKQLVYWTFPNSDSNPTFPNKVLVYNYLDGSYSFFNDSLTCFGNYQPFTDTTWSQVNIPWTDYDKAWDSGELQSDYPEICAGNQQGFVFNNYNNGDIANEKSLFISGATQALPCVITSPNHNLSDGTVIQISGVSGMTQLNGNIYQVNFATQNTFSLYFWNTGNTPPKWEQVDSTAFGAYTGSGLITVINNINITTKRFNPFLEAGDQVRLQWVDLFLEASATVQFTLSVFLDENPNTVFEVDVVTPNSVALSKVWLRSYISVIGQFCQLTLSFDDEQMNDPALSSGDVTLHAMMLWMSNGGRLTYGTSM